MHVFRIVAKKFLDVKIVGLDRIEIFEFLS